MRGPFSSKSFHCSEEPCTHVHTPPRATPLMGGTWVIMGDTGSVENAISRSVMVWETLLVAMNRGPRGQSTEQQRSLQVTSPGL